MEIYFILPEVSKNLLHYDITHVMFFSFNPQKHSLIIWHKIHSKFMSFPINTQLLPMKCIVNFYWDPDAGNIKLLEKDMRYKVS